MSYFTYFESSKSHYYLLEETKIYVGVEVPLIDGIGKSKVLNINATLSQETLKWSLRKRR